MIEFKQRQKPNWDTCDTEVPEKFLWICWRYGKRGMIFNLPGVQINSPPVPSWDRFYRTIQVFLRILPPSGYFWGLKQYFGFRMGFFFHPRERKNRRKKTDHIIPSLFYGSIAKIIGILTEIKRDILPNLNLSKTTMIKIYLKETVLKADFSSWHFFSINKSLSLSPELFILN